MTMKHLTLACVALLCSLSANANETADPVQIGSRRELFVDRYLIDRLDGVRLQLHQPQARDIALNHDSPWEGTGSGYHSVFKDGDQYRMYYKAWHLDVKPQSFKAGSRLYCCYAESDDGIHWRKPELGLHEFDGSTKNNIVMKSETYGSSISDPGHCAVFKDDNPNVRPDAIYKAIIRAKEPHGLMGFKSADGLRWTPVSNLPIITDGAFDSQNLAFWDPTIGRYRAYWRYFTSGVTSGQQWKPGGIRAIRTATSSDFLSWENPSDLTYADSPPEQLYTNQIKPYRRAPHILIGFPTRYVDRGWSDSMRALPDQERRKWRASANQRYGTALTDALLMSSRDGVKFDRWNEAFLRPGIERSGTWHYGQQYIAWHLVETRSTLEGGPNELSLYATEDYWHGKGSRLRRYTLRLDGFVSASAPRDGGRLQTRPVVFSGDRLEINFATSAAGALRVELQDPNGKPLDGFSLDDCPEIFGDSVTRIVRWEGNPDLSAIRGQPVRLLFELTDADLYSFRFTPQPTEPTTASELELSIRLRALDVLRKGMRADEFWPAIHAAEALTLSGHGEEVIAFLKPKLSAETDDQRRCGIARELVRSGDVDQTLVLFGILRGPDPHGHVHAAESLYKVGWVGDAQPLQHAFAQSNDVRLRLMAAAALAKHGRDELQSEAFAYLRAILVNESDPDLFRLAAWVLGRIGDATDIARIRNRIDDANNPVAVAFLQHALASLGDPMGRAELTHNLESPDPAIRTYAAVFAGESRLTGAVPLLIRQLDDPNIDARIRAAQSLLILAE